MYPPHLALQPVIMCRAESNRENTSPPALGWIIYIAQQ